MFGRNHPKRPTFPLQTMERVSILLAAASLNCERGQVHARLFTQLDERQPHVRVAMQMLARDFVEHRDTAEVIAPFEKEPHQAADAFWRADRVAQRRPCATLHGVHDERGLLFVEEDRLVAEKHEVRRRGRSAALMIAAAALRSASVGVGASCGA